MNETLVTVVGNVATQPEYRLTASGAGVVRFRLAATARRWDRTRQSWVDGSTSFYTVWAWRSLAENLAASVTLGEPLVVHGRLRVREEWREERPVPAAGAAPDAAPGGPGTARGAPEGRDAWDAAGGTAGAPGPSGAEAVPRDDATGTEQATGAGEVNGAGSGPGGSPPDRPRRGGSGGAGARWVSAEIDAVAVGHDLSRGTAAFRRVSLARPQLVGATTP
ncbi:single-stranded DNA-binding protein [Streptomyces pactum]|uniref:single-stranded DNA-binding protein n=1 Tax=Streptomyces pactum TaxID=68249 RepID=UPI0027DB382D|nr:single-stranded DNA-binding protein [Streptomyces pactum]